MSLVGLASFPGLSAALSLEGQVCLHKVNIQMASSVYLLLLNYTMQKITCIVNGAVKRFGNGSVFVLII